MNQNDLNNQGVRWHMNRTLLYLITIFFVIALGCTKSVDNPSVRSAEIDSSKTTISQPSSVKNYPDGKSGTHGVPSWILDMHHTSAVLRPFQNFFLLNGRFPYDVKEFLDSGLILVWPAYPQTGEPMKLVKKVEPNANYLDKIAYVRKSDSEAYFEFVKYFEARNEFGILDFPPKFVRDRYTSSTYVNKYSDKAPLLAQTFHKMMNSLYAATIQRDEYLQGAIIPSTVEETVKGNFFWIKENMAPDFLSTSPDEYVFYEWGIAEIENVPVAFFRFTLPYETSAGNVRPAKYMDIRSLEGGRSYTDDYWDLLTNMKYIYSSKQLVEGTFSVSDEIMISKDQILNPVTDTSAGEATKKSSSK
jgi:hypothetical protein